jgi:hypothetical protein
VSGAQRHHAGEQLGGGLGLLGRRGAEGATDAPERGADQLGVGGRAGAQRMAAKHRPIVEALVPASASAARKAATVAEVASSGAKPRTPQQARKMAQSDP